MTWLIILLVLVVVIGPVMYLVPSASDKRLVGLRAAARSKGLNVRITTVPKLDPSSDERVTSGAKRLDPRISCAAYHLQVGESLSGIGNWRLLRMPPQATVMVNEVTPGWALDNESDAASWARYDAAGKGVACLHSIVPLLPEDVLAIALDARSVSCYWREKADAESGVVERLAEALGTLRDDLIARFG